MTHKIKAFQKQLSWQSQFLYYDLQRLNEQLEHVQSQHNCLQQRLQQGFDPRQGIQPEQEIVRIRFIAQQQHSLQVFETQKKSLTEDLRGLKQQQLRVKTELKLLEKYLKKSADKYEQEQAALQQIQGDEWALLRRHFL